MNARTSCLALAALLVLPILLWPSLHGEQGARALSIASSCSEGVLREGLHTLWGCVSGANRYGDLWFLLLTGWSLVFGASWIAAMGLMLLLTAWTLLGAWRLGERIGGSGPWAAGLLAVLPAFGHAARHVQLDMLLMGCVVWFLAVLAGEGTRRSLGLLAALLLAGLMTKPPAAAFMLPAAALLWGWRREGLVGAAVLGGTLALSWLGMAQGDDWRLTLRLAESVVKDPLDFPPLGGPRWLYYGQVAWRLQLGLAGVALAGLGLWKARRSPLAWMLLAAALGGIAAHTGLAYRKHYYTTPILAPLAALASIWLTDRRGWGRGTLIALMAVALLHHSWGLPGVADGLPGPLRGLAINEPRAFNPEPQRVPTEVGRAAAVALALAERDGGLKLLGLPRGPKLRAILDRPDLLSFEHALDYELRRRGAPLHTLWPAHGAAVDGARLVFFEGREPDVDALMAGCSALEGAQRDLSERAAKTACPLGRTDFERLVRHVHIVQRTELAPGRWRSLGVLPVRGDAPWGAPVALRALRYAKELRVQLDPDIEAEAAKATPAMRAEDAAKPLEYFRARKEQRVFPW